MVFGPNGVCTTLASSTCLSICSLLNSSFDTILVIYLWTMECNHFFSLSLFISPSPSTLFYHFTASIREYELMTVFTWSMNIILHSWIHNQWNAIFPYDQRSSSKCEDEIERRKQKTERKKKHKNEKFQWNQWLASELIIECYHIQSIWMHFRSFFIFFFAHMWGKKIQHSNRFQCKWSLTNEQKSYWK